MQKRSGHWWAVEVGELKAMLCLTSQVVLLLCECVHTNGQCLFFLICQVVLIEFMWLSFSLPPCFSFCICALSLCGPRFHISHLTNLHNGLMFILHSNSNPFLHSTPTDPSFVQANVNSHSTIARVLYSCI